ncbi:hypothetical protein LINPERPRIM_LOCUS32205 [Linum perenne]
MATEREASFINEPEKLGVVMAAAARHGAHEDVIGSSIQAVAKHNCHCSLLWYSVIFDLSYAVREWGGYIGRQSEKRGRRKAKRREDSMTATNAASRLEGQIRPPRPTCDTYAVDTTSVMKDFIN